jgi:hypothetical protein
MLSGNRKRRQVTGALHLMPENVFAPALRWHLHKKLL